MGQANGKKAFRLTAWQTALILSVYAVICQDNGYHLAERYSVCIDPSFSDNEKQLIREGMVVWNTNKIRFFEGDSCNLNIVKADSWDEDHTDENHIGVADFYRNKIILFPDRIINHDETVLRWLAAHETGHWIGLDHVDPFKAPAIMDAQVRKDVADNLKLYPEDLKQLCRIWTCQ